MAQYNAQMSNPLLENAIDLIQVAIEDYKVGTNQRMKSSIRSVYAGTLLLCKHVLFKKGLIGSTFTLQNYISEHRISIEGLGRKNFDQLSNYFKKLERAMKDDKNFKIGKGFNYKDLKLF